MNNYINLVKSSVASKNIYNLPKTDYNIKLDQNENPNDLPDELKSAVLKAIFDQNWNRYPELLSGNIRQKIGNWLDLPWNSIMVGNGSNEILLAIMMTLLETGKRLVTVSPTFYLYSFYGDILNAKIDVVPLMENFQFPVAELVSKVSEPDVTLTVLCSPNNPTGNGISSNDLLKILKAAHGFVLVDEAYHDFSSQDFSILLDSYPNLILTRTFSKAYGFSLGRFGYGLGASELVTEVYKVLLPYNLNGFSELAAGIFIQNSDHIKRKSSEIIRQRDWLFQQLNGISGLEVYPSEANFILIRPDCDCSFLFDQLVLNGILLRDVSFYPGLGNHLRITVGRPEENQAVLKLLRQFVTGIEK